MPIPISSNFPNNLINSDFLILQSFWTAASETQPFAFFAIRRSFSLSFHDIWRHQYGRAAQEAKSDQSMSYAADAETYAAVFQPESQVRQADFPNLSPQSTW